MRSSDIPLPLAIPRAGVVGLFVGSFLNVVVYRTPLGLSVSAPRSFCPTCRRQLTWWENVPIGSWVALRGRCRTCRAVQSPRGIHWSSIGTAVVFRIGHLGLEGDDRVGFGTVKWPPP